MQSTESEEIKAALWEQSQYPCTQVKWGRNSGLLSHTDDAPCRMGLSFSLAYVRQCLFPQPLYVAHRWDAEEAFVLSIEVGGVLVAHAIGCTCRVEVFAQHQTAGLLQP